MTGCISIKVTTVKAERRSRGRVATSTRTLVRNVRDDAHPAQIMRLMSELFPLLEHVPVSYQVRGVRYELLRVETRTVDGVRVSRAVFKDERAVRRSFAREMRRRHRAARRADVRAARAEAHRRRAHVNALLTHACAAKKPRTAPHVITASAPSALLSVPCLYAPTPRPLLAIPSVRQKTLKIWAAAAA